MRMALLESTSSNTHEVGLGTEVGEVLGTQVAHAGAEAADKLEYDIAQMTTERDAAFHSFGDEFAG